MTLFLMYMLGFVIGCLVGFWYARVLQSFKKVG